MSLLWVAGGRDYSNVIVMREAMRPYFDEGMTLITGAARGADLTAETIWREWEGRYIGVPAIWSSGRGAGPRRNIVIADDYRPKLLLWFPGGAGTAHAVKTARKYGIVSVDAVRIGDE